MNKKPYQHFYDCCFERNLEINIWNSDIDHFDSRLFTCSIQVEFIHKKSYQFVTTRNLVCTTYFKGKEFDKRWGGIAYNSYFENISKDFD